MSGRSTDSMSYIADQARRLDPDRHFVAMLAPLGCRGHLMTLIAFSAEIGAVRAAVSEAMIGQMKFAWWRDVVATLGAEGCAPQGHPLSEALDTLTTETTVDPGLLSALIDAREAELLDQNLSSVQALLPHVKATTLPLMQGMANILSETTPPQHLDQLSAFHGFTRSLSALATEASQAADLAQAGRELEAGLDIAQTQHEGLKRDLGQRWPKPLRPLLPLFAVSARRLDILRQTQNGVQALSLRPSVTSSLMAMWFGKP